MRTLGFLLLIALGIFFGWVILLNQTEVPIHLDPFGVGMFAPNPRPMTVWGVIAWFLVIGALLGYVYGAVNRPKKRSDAKPKDSETPATETTGGNDIDVVEINFLNEAVRRGKR